MPEAAVITFPGSNCDDDLIYVLGKSGFQVTRLWHKDHPSLSKFQLVLLPGGFAYGDYLRTGAVAAHSPVMDEVKSFASKGGKVLGVCNGFQILCEAGLLPGALAINKNLGFVCKDVFLKVANGASPWVKGIAEGDVLSFPIAHGEGRYIVSDEEWEKLNEKKQILFQYCGPAGELTEGANPNGSVKNIAGVCNESQNVMGLMPHPERATFLRSGDGVKFWTAVSQGLK